MSARELHRFMRSGKKSLSFKDVEPFVDKNQFALLRTADAVMKSIIEKKKKGEGIPAEMFRILGALKYAGAFVHPLSFQACLRLECNGLSVSGIPFEVFFHQLAGAQGIGGTFMNSGDKGTSSVFLSLNSALHMISGYLASNNLKGVEIQGIGREFLLKKHEEGTLLDIPRETLVELSHHLLGTRLFEAELGRLFPEKTTEQYVNLVESCLGNISLHEAAHVLHSTAGIIGAGGVEREEYRAYLTELAYGNPGLSLAYLPYRKRDDPNCRAASAALEKIFDRMDFAAFMGMDAKAVSEMARRLLDEDFLQSFGKHHDEIIPRLEIGRVRKHRFFSEKQFPMLEGLRYLPDNPEKKAA